MLVSDHGGGPLHGVVNLNAWLAEQGLLEYAGAAELVRGGQLQRMAAARALALWRRLPLDLRTRVKQRLGGLRERSYELQNYSVVDFERTRAFAYGTFGNIVINVQGRERNGIVAPGRGVRGRARRDREGPARAARSRERPPDRGRGAPARGALQRPAARARARSRGRVRRLRVARQGQSQEPHREASGTRSRSRARTPPTSAATATRASSRWPAPRPRPAGCSRRSRTSRRRSSTCSASRFPRAWRGS